MNILTTWAFVVSSIVMIKARKSFVWYNANILATFSIIVLAIFFLLTLGKELPTRTVAVLTALAYISAAVQTVSTKRNHIKFSGDAIKVCRRGKSAEYGHSDIRVDACDNKSIYKIIVDGGEYYITKGEHEDFDRWLGVQLG